MQIKANCIVLYALPYKMTDEKTGEVNQGVSIAYYPSDNLVPVVEGDSKGQRPIKDSLPVESWKDVADVPGIYELGFKMNGNSLGQGKLKVTDLKFVKKFQ